MIQRIGFGLLWLAFTVYAFFLAPPDDPEATFELIRRLISGDIAGINPLIVAEFNLMGVLPFLYWTLLFIDGARQKHMGQQIPAWPFAGLMMAVGAFALLPYLVLRRPLDGSEPLPPFDWNLRLWNSPWTGRILSLVTLGLLGYGITQGDWLEFIQTWQTNRFIHVMTLDFLLLSSLLPFCIANDQVGRRTSWVPSGVINWIPLLGSLAYLSTRPDPSS
jgi:hypothetical protein